MIPRLLIIVCKSRRYLLQLVVTLGAASGLYACSGLGYSVSAANYTNDGIVLFDLPIAGVANKKSKRWYLSSNVPGTARKKWLGTFFAYPKRLPDELIIKWKTAKLSNCEISDQFKSSNYSDEEREELSRPLRDAYMFRMDCDWLINDSNVYTKKLDIEAIRQSEEYANATGFKNPLGANPTLKIELLFWAPDDLQVRLRNGRTMAFME